MPKGIASRIREAIAKEDKTGLVLKRATGKSKTGFVGVIKVGNLFQGRLQVKGDGRGGRLKRRQVSLPGLWKTAEEAAQMLAILEKAGPEKLWPGGVPPKQDTEHKPRSKPLPRAPRAPLVDVPMPAAFVVGMPIPCPMPHAPIVVARPMFTDVRAF